MEWDKLKSNSPKPIRATKLQFAKMKQYPTKKCFQAYFPKLKNKPLPKDFTESLEKGFCLKGINKETPRIGDSGAPAFWYNKKGEAYLGGILFRGFDIFFFNYNFFKKLDYVTILY